ncbi:high mobility group B protein 1 [Cryptomeria japonica]|uniref:high mobility group B protein 1 n=1 Tax=Cryptomeria japonica TaxID=3369 RepID=UPI0025ACF0F5|nr:high mobility group B protein 1 [Cryptomeria japonica]
MKGGKAKAEQSDSLRVVGDKKIGKQKKAPTEKQLKRQAKKEKKAKKDPNKPKRPPSGFFVFLEGFRKQYKEANPNSKSISAVAKAGGEKWQSMSEAEKAPFEATAAKKKAEYQNAMAAYNNKQEASAEESDKSKSEVNDEEDSGEEEDD